MQLFCLRKGERQCLQECFNVI